MGLGSGVDRVRFAASAALVAGVFVWAVAPGGAEPGKDALGGKDKPEEPNAASEQPKEFYYDFRRPPIPPELTLFHAEDDKSFAMEAEGLRIAIPQTWIHREGGVGFKTSFGIEGDFAVTATVEVLHLEPPPSGYGAGVGIRVETATEGAYLQRLITPKGRNIVLWGRHFPDPEKKNTQWRQNGSGCDDSLVRLRLQRTGTTLSYLWAPGVAGGDFEEINKVEFGNNNIDHVRLTAGTGQKPCNLEVRLIDLRITKGTPVSDLAAATSSRFRASGWLAAAVLLGFGIILLTGLGWWLYLRRSYPSRK